METEAATRPSGNPIGVMVVAIATGLRAVFVAAALLLDAGVIKGDWLAAMSPIPVYAGTTSIGLISRGMLVAMLLISVLCIWGLLRRRQWGWTLSIVSAGIILALNLGWWAAGDPHHLSMVVNSIAVFYLNQRDVRAAFRVGHA